MLFRSLETSEANARQLVSRAREHLRSRRARQKVEPERHRRLLVEFLRACADGDAASLMGLLKDDAVLYSDGGGKTQAALNPIYGADKIIRFIQGISKKGLGEWGAYALEVNGGPGAMVTVDGRPNTLLTIEPDGERIGTIFYVRNPDKMPGSLSMETPRHAAEI